MRQLVVLAAMVALAGAVNGAADDPVSCKAEGLHICCPACVKSITDTLEPVKGITNTTVDRPSKSVTFTASDQAVAQKAHEALAKAGFGFTFKAGDKSIDMPAQKFDGKTDTVVFKAVHDCCAQCTGAINKLFNEGTTKVAISSKGKQRDLTVTGQNLDPNDLLQRLQKAGFTGVMEATKK
jgi:copper chaperone CopZ